MGVRNCESCTEWAWAFGTARLVELFQEEGRNPWAGCNVPEATWQGVLGRVRGELTEGFVSGALGAGWERLRQTYERASSGWPL